MEILADEGITLQSSQHQGDNNTENTNQQQEKHTFKSEQRFHIITTQMQSVWQVIKKCRRTEESPAIMQLT